MPRVTSPSRDLLQSGNPVHELSALVALVRSHLFGPARLTAAVDYYGSAVDLIKTAMYGGVGAQHVVLSTIESAAIDSATSEVHAWIEAGLSVRSFLDSEYPQNLLSVHNRPPWLFLAGYWNPDQDSKAVAVVGTRKASVEGIQRARRLSRDLVAAGYTVFSGLARGVDTAAHLAALKAGGRTIAVMGTGILRRYPRENAKIADAIIESGSALISPFAPEQPPTKWTFPVRNVAMSGMCLATIVVEAGETSGARMQAEAALYHGRSVFLPSSLVRAHSWARGLVETGLHGVRAVEVASTDDVLGRLQLAPSYTPAVAA